MAREALKAVAETAAQTRTGSDPLTVVLPALAALGGIASLAALNWAERGEPGDRRRARRQVQVSLRELGRDCRDLQDLFRKLVRGLPGIATGGGSAGLPLRFGVHGLKVDSGTYPHFQSLVASLASLTSRVAHHTFEVRSAIEEGLLEPPEDLFFAFGDQQERLNGILAGRPSLKSAIEIGFDIALKLTGIVEELEAYIVG